MIEVTLLPDINSPSPQPGDIGEVISTDNGLVYVYWRRTESVEAFPVDRLVPSPHPMER